MQLNLFDSNPQADASGLVARARRTDPASSKSAAVEVEEIGSAGTDRAKISAYVHAHRTGLTGGEIAVGLGWGAEANNRVMRRICELVGLGEVKRGEDRVCRVKGRKMYTIWPGY